MKKLILYSCTFLIICFGALGSESGDVTENTEEASQIIEIYKRYPYQPYRTVFQAACIAGDIEAVSTLLKAGYDPNHYNRRGEDNPAIEYLFGDLTKNMSLETRLSMLKLLLDHGARMEKHMVMHSIWYFMRYEEDGVIGIKMIVESGNSFDGGLSTAARLHPENRGEQLYQQQVMELLIDHGATF